MTTPGPSIGSAQLRAYVRPSVDTDDTIVTGSDSDLSLIPAQAQVTVYPITLQNGWAPATADPSDAPKIEVFENYAELSGRIRRSPVPTVGAKTVPSVVGTIDPAARPVMNIEEQVFALHGNDLGATFMLRIGTNGEISLQQVKWALGRSSSWWKDNTHIVPLYQYWIIDNASHTHQPDQVRGSALANVEPSNSEWRYSYDVSTYTGSVSGAHAAAVAGGAGADAIIAAERQRQEAAAAAAAAAQRAAAAAAAAAAAYPHGLTWNDANQNRVATYKGNCAQRTYGWNGRRVYYGYYDSTNGDQKGTVVFDSGFQNTLRALNSGSIQMCHLKFYNEHTFFNGGGQVNVSFWQTWNPDCLGTSPYTMTVNVPHTGWVEVPIVDPWVHSFILPTCTGVSFTATSGSRNNYGFLDGKSVQIVVNAS